MGRGEPRREQPFDEAVRETIEEAFSQDVTVKVYDNRGKLDVRVEPNGVTEALEAELDDANVVPYGEFKFTVTDERD